MRKGILLLVLGMACMLSACGEKKELPVKEVVPEYVFTYAENQPDDYPTTQGAYRFSELVEARTQGRIRIQVKAGGELGAEQSVIEQLQFGGIDFARVSLSPLGEKIPKLNVLQMPYLYLNSRHMWRVLEGKIGDEFLESFQGSDLIALSWYDAGARSFYSSKKPIERLADMKGMKIRVQESSLMGRMVELLGAVPVPLEYSEVYSAFQTGQIDAAENNWPSYESMNHVEVAEYMTLDEHTRIPEVQLASQVTWEKLSKEDQDIIRKCAEESARYERLLWEDRAHQAEEAAKRKGCQVILLEDAEKAHFREAVLPIYQEFCEKYQDIIDRITEVGVAMKKESGKNP